MKRVLFLMILLMSVLSAAVASSGFTCSFHIKADGYSAEFEYERRTLRELFKGISRTEKYGQLTASGMDGVAALNEIAEGLGDFVKEITGANYVPATSAEATFTKGKTPFTYTPHCDGSRVDEEALLTDIAAQLGGKNISVEVRTVPVSADLTEERLRQSTVLLSSFSTKYASSGAARKNNIKVAVSRVDGTILQDKARFSFNEVVGARSVANGFSPAPIIVNGRFTEGVGGGVCQVSTTIYNAVLTAGLTVNVVSRHSLSVGYVAPSFDAMVSSASDLVFTNETGMPVYISATADGTTLSVRIYGLPSGYDIRLKSVVKRVVPYGGTITEDNTLAEGERRVLTAGKNGIVSEGYLCYFKDGKSVSCKKIRSDVYAAVNEEVVVGTLPLNNPTTEAEEVD